MSRRKIPAIRAVRVTGELVISQNASRSWCPGDLVIEGLTFKLERDIRISLSAEGRSPEKEMSRSWRNVTLARCGTDEHQSVLRDLMARLVR